jgi:hypothetical protein
MQIDFDKLEPGRDTDALVAEVCEGYRRERIGKDADGNHGGTEVLVPPTIGDEFYKYLPLKGEVHLGYFAPEYSTKDGDAFELQGRLREQGFDFMLTHDPGYPVYADLGRFGDPRSMSGHGAAETRAMAICIAALKAFCSAQPAEPPPVREIELKLGGGACVRTNSDGTKEALHYRFGYEDKA